MKPYNLVERGEDGFYHPGNEEQIVALVKKAHDEGKQIRVRGAAHSLARAIYTDPGDGFPEVRNTVSEQSPPDGPNINIMLDNFKQMEWIDEEKGIVEVEAGIHLGADPLDPTGTSPLSRSLLYQAHLKGWTLNDLGGITHQTVSGFLMTGSSGGTLMYYLDENLLAFRIVDGTGRAEWVEKKKQKDLYCAVGLSLGLLGIITKVRLQLTKEFSIYGQETTHKIDGQCPIDLFDDGDEKTPGLLTFFRETPYSRILWWPQKGVNRIVVWKAVRGDRIPAFTPFPYHEFEKKKFTTQLEELAGAVLFTLLGNRGFTKFWSKLKRDFIQFRTNLGKKRGRTPEGNARTAWFIPLCATVFLELIFFPLVLFFSTFRGLLIRVYPWIVDVLEPLTGKEEGKIFMDYVWRSLPMDNAADDVLMGTEFTELWIPVKYTAEVMRLLRQQFERRGFDATGYYATELYTGIKSDFWLSPSYKENVFRVDFFWHINNAGNPGSKDGYYAQFWELLRKHNIPFRLHWAKFLPEYDYKEWAEYMRSQYPKWDDFMRLRRERDPRNIFLTRYWQKHLFGEE
jgi:FAD/FMN-containing dehydrogenase